MSQPSDAPGKRPVPWKALVASVVVLVAVAWAASPLFSVAQLRSAARSGDADRLEDMVDFPAVRADLKSQLSAAFLGQVQSDSSMRNNPFAALGAALAPMILDKVVDAYVTPDGIAAMIKNARAPSYGADSGSGGSNPAMPNHAGSNSTEAHYEYLSPNKFRVRIASADAPDRPISFILERRGLFGWKLERIRLPLQQAAATGPTQAPSASSPPPTAESASVAGADASAIVKPGDCVSTTITQIGTRLEGMPDSGSAIEYADGHAQVSYDVVPGIQQAKVGDPVTLCLVSLPQNCPPGDDRGKIYNAVDGRTGLSWQESDSEHECGGA